MPTWAEVLRDGTRGGEETLGLDWGLKPLHALLALTGGLVRVLCTITEIPVLSMFHSWENLSLGGSVALPFVSDDHAGRVPGACG
jgi:hypothetical protein